MRVDRERLIVVDNGAVLVALSGVGEAAVVESGRVFGIDPDRLAVVGYGAVVVFLVEIDVASAVIGECIPRIEADAWL